MNFYNISQAAQRQQTAQHFHSSLEEPTLDNVEAQLQVARQRNYQLSLSYFQNKYGSGEAYNQYVQSHGLEGLGPPPQQQFDLKRELEKQAEEIRQRQMRKIQERRQGRLGQEEEDEGQSGSRPAGRKAKSRANPWAEESKAEVQPAVEKPAMRVEEQFYEINVGREKEGAFISEFKNYLANKRKPKQQQQQQQQTGSPSAKKTLSQSFNLSQLKNASSLSQNKSSGPKYEEELVRKIMRDIAGRCEPTTRIEKLQLIEYLTANPKIPRVLGVPEGELSGTVLGLACKDANLLSFSEVLGWVLGATGKGEQARRLRAAEEFEQVPTGCMLSRELLGLFEETFRSMDRHGDLLVKRAPFLARLTNDPLVKRALNLPAVFEPEYNRHVSLRRVLERLEIEGLLCPEEERRANEFISWRQFIGHFQSGHRARGKYDLIVLLESLRGEEKFGLAHLPDSVFEILNWGVGHADRGEELLSTAEILNEIKLHRDYEIEKFTFLRNASEDGASETFEDVLVRIKEQAQSFLTPKEFLEYFSVRGKPIEDHQKQRNEQQAKNLSAVKVTFIENDLFAKADHPDGYDSDPETYNNSALHQQPDPHKSQKEFRRFKATAQSFLEPEQPPADTTTDQRQFKLTVPQPFSFEEREKERRARREQSEQSPSKAEAVFRAAPVPASVAEVGLYERMREEQRRKNEERKKCSMIMTLANERPFSFEGRKTAKKSKEEREQFVFKAKPIPWFCSVDLLRKKQEEEILRNERIAKLAQENLAKAKLPPRMEKDFLQKEARKMQEQKGSKRPASSQPRAKQPPNFDRLHREFEEALERKRKENKTTEVCEFKFATTNPKASKIAPAPPEEPARKGEIPSTKSNIDIFAQSTAKFTQQVQRRRQQAQEKRREEGRRRREEEARGRVDEELRAKVQEAAKKSRETKEAEEAVRRREENAAAEQKFQEWKKECVGKGRQQPLLIDRVSKRDEKIEKMKRLYEISQTLIANGIKGKEHDHYFKREELLLLQDYKELKGKL